MHEILPHSNSLMSSQREVNFASMRIPLIAKIIAAPSPHGRVSIWCYLAHLPVVTLHISSLLPIFIICPHKHQFFGWTTPQHMSKQIHSIYHSDLQCALHETYLAKHIDTFAHAIHIRYTQSFLHQFRFLANMFVVQNLFLQECTPLISHNQQHI